MTERSDCRSCHAPMEWALSVPKDASKESKRIPLDVDAVDPASNGGALALVPTDSDVARVIKGDAAECGYRYLAVGRTLLAESYARVNGLTFIEARMVALRSYEWRLVHFVTCAFADAHRAAR